MGLERRGIRVSNRSEDDLWRYWLPVSERPDEAEVRQRIRDETGESDPGVLDELAAYERNTPHVVIGGWRDLEVLLAGNDPSLATVFVADPLSAFYRPNFKVLRKLSSTSRLFGICERFGDQPRADRDRIQSLFGTDQLTYVSKEGAAIPPVVEFEMMPFRRKKAVSPAGDPGIDREVTNAAEGHRGRNGRIRETAARELAAFGCGPQRIALVSGSQNHTLQLLDRLDENWKAIVYEYYDVPKQFIHLKNRLIRVPARGRISQEAVRAIRAYPRLVVPYPRTTLVGHRRTWIRTDVGREGLRLTGAQQVAPDGKPVRIVDIGDTWQKELTERTADRFGAYRSAGWSVKTPPPEGVVGKARKRVKLPKQTVPYAARSRRREKQTNLVEKAKTLVSTKRLAHGVPLISAVADASILLGALTELATSDQCGDAAGVDKVRPSMVGRSERLQIAQEIGSLLRSGDYRPAPVKEVKIAKHEMPTLPDDWREIGVPTVVDRAVQKSLVWTIRKHFKPRARYADNTPCSWAATGLGRMRMLANVKQRIDAMLADGQTSHLLTCDIEGAFDRVRPADVMGQIGAGGLNLFSETRGRQKAEEAEGELRLGEQHSRGFPKHWRHEMRRLRTLIEQVLQGHANNKQGIVQGGPFSPWALDLLLDGRVDKRMIKLNETKSLRFWRYVDDMLMLGPSAKTCTDAVDEVLRPQLELHGMNLKTEKTQTANLNDGESIEALGLVLSLQDGELVFWAPATSVETAVAALVEAGLREEPLQRIQSSLKGLLGAYAPVLGEDQQFGLQLRNAVLDQDLSGISDLEYERMKNQAVSNWQRVLSGTGEEV